MRLSLDVKFYLVGLLTICTGAAVEWPVEPIGQSSRLTGLVISEIMYHPAARADGKKLEFVEIMNTLDTPQEVSGYALSGDVDFLFPTNTFIPARGFFVVARRPADVESVYGITGVWGPFANDKNLPNGSGVVRLRNRQGATLLEVPYKSAAPWPSQADGAGPSLVLARPSYGEADPRAWSVSATNGGTPGALNTVAPDPVSQPLAPLPASSVVLNEIMYNPASGLDSDQYIELFNGGSEAVDLSGWTIDGIKFTFPKSSSIPAGGYLVVAKAAQELRSKYPNLNVSNSVGDFSGTLSHSGERVALTKPVTSGTNTLQVVVDAVTYAGGGRWPELADGGGSSLERIDPRADGRLAPNWAASEESAKAEWTNVTATGVLDNGNVAADELQVLLQGAGECLIDNVQVLNSAGVNVIANSTFETDDSGWTPEGTEQRSGWEATEGFQSAHSYHIRAVERGDNQVNRVRVPLTTVLAANSTATIRANVRWLSGTTGILFRLRGNWLEAAGTMNLPAKPGTPGAPNSRLVANAGPAITEVSHSPVVPAAGQAIVVKARVSDPDGIGSATVRYRLDPSATLRNVTMRDDGTGGDEVAGDGIYSGTIPGQAAGTLVAFQIVAADKAGASALFPADAPVRECLVRFGESTPNGDFPVYRIWMTQATYNEWTTRSKLNNTPLDVTFVSGSSRAIYNTQALYAGSPYIAPGYSSPTSGRCGYSVTFPPDDRFLGNQDLVLDWPGGHGGERTALQEQMAYWLAEQVDLPYCNRYTIRLQVNGVTDMQRGGVFEAVNQPAGDFVKAWMPNDSKGDFYKIDRAFEFSDGGGLIADPQPRLQKYVTTGGVKKTARYRWNWYKRAGSEPNNYTNIFNVVDAVNAPAPEPYTSGVEALVNIDEWMGILAMEHIIVNFDAYGHEIGKNMYGYKPNNGKWQLYMFDLDWLMLAAPNHMAQYAASSAPLYNSEDPTISRMYNHPPFRRAYLQTVQRAVDGPMRAEVCNPVMDAKYQALVANGVTMCDGQTLTSPAAVKTWFAQRRTYLLNQLAQVAADFTVSGGDFATNASVVRVAGTAPIPVKTIRLNGADLDVTWDTVTDWSAVVNLTSGANALHFDGYDKGGALVGTATVNITNTAPALRLTVLNTGQGRIQFTWDSVGGHSYTIQYKDDLGASAWSRLDDVVATGSTVTAEVPFSAPKRFYRVTATAR